MDINISGLFSIYFKLE